MTYPTIEYLLLIIAVLIIVSILANKVSGRLGVPALLIFLVVGMLAGSEGPGGIIFNDPIIAQAIGVVALTFILFSGGLDTRWSEVRPVLPQAAVLSTLGVLLTALFMAAIAIVMFDVSLLEGFLLAAVVSSTDAAAVFSILRTKRAGLKGTLRPLLELESASNDPMAVFLTIAAINLILHPELSVFSAIPLFIQQMAVGGLIGYFIGKGTVVFLNKLDLEFEGLYMVLSLALVMATYAVTASLGGSGFLAVYISGLFLGNSRFVHKKSLMRFHEGISWLMQIVLFVTLGLLVYPSNLVPIAGIGILFSLFLILVARPFAVFISLAPWRLGLRYKVMVSWVGLRGAVPIVLATFPLVAGIPQADIIFNIVFFIVLTSALLHGTSIPFVARKLGVAAPLKDDRALERSLDNSVGETELIELSVPPDAKVVGMQIVDLGLPPGTLIIMMEKGEKRFVPSGSTIVGQGDLLLILTNRALADQVRSLFSSKATPDLEYFL